MNTDIRFPIGLLFSILGVIITIYGFITNGGDIYKHSLGININLYSGVGLLVFGVLMLGMAVRAQAKGKTKAE
jgi:hypothetical protein